MSKLTAPTIPTSNLAQLLQGTNRQSDAEPLMRRALAIDEHVHGPDHPDVARDLNNSARLLQDMKRPDEAEPMIRRVVEIFTKAYGTEHPKAAVSLNNLAGLLEKKRPEDAEPLFR